MSSAITYGVLVLITIVCLFPIVWMCLISIKDISESITGFNSILVTHPTLGNFKRLFEICLLYTSCLMASSALPRQTCL